MRRSYRICFRSAHNLRKPIEKGPLAFENLRVSMAQIKPFGAVDLRKDLHPSAFRRPFNFERVAFYSSHVDVAFGSERNAPLAATLADPPKRFKRPDETDPRFLHELPAGGVRSVLACLHFAFRNGPDPRIPAAT